MNKMSAFASKLVDLRSCFVEDGQNYTKVRVARAAGVFLSQPIKLLSISIYFLWNIPSLRLASCHFFP